jgi:hypothetical protein
MRTSGPTVYQLLKYFIGNLIMDILVGLSDRAPRPHSLRSSAGSGSCTTVWSRCTGSKGDLKRLSTEVRSILEGRTSGPGILCCERGMQPSESQRWS